MSESVAPVYIWRTVSLSPVNEQMVVVGVTEWLGSGDKRFSFDLLTLHFQMFYEAFVELPVGGNSLIIDQQSADAQRVSFCGQCALTRCSCFWGGKREESSTLWTFSFVVIAYNIFRFCSWICQRSSTPPLFAVTTSQTFLKLLKHYLVFSSPCKFTLWIPGNFNVMAWAASPACFKELCQAIRQVLDMIQTGSSGFC